MHAGKESESRWTLNLICRAKWAHFSKQKYLSLWNILFNHTKTACMGWRLRESHHVRLKILSQEIKKRDATLQWPSQQWVTKPWLTAGHDTAATIKFLQERKTLNSPLAMQTEMYLSSVQLALVEQLGIRLKQRKWTPSVHKPIIYGWCANLGPRLPWLSLIVGTSLFAWG